MELVAQQPFLAQTPVAGIAVCYQCSYQSSDCASSCPECNFPMIVQSGLSSPGIRLGDVLKRETLRTGAPPLPGVHAGKRKAQLMAEARKRIRGTERHATQEESSSAQAETATRRSFWGLASVCCIAVGVGVVAAAVQSVFL
jgi:hypothetical protein